MATKYYQKHSGSFKTGFHQRELTMDLKVDGDGGIDGTAATTSVLTLRVGDLVEISSGAIVPVVTSSATSAAAVAAPTIDTDMYIVAQSDMTLEYGHVPVENRDYRYDNKVADSATDKKVALFHVTDPADIIVTSVAFTTA